jgi:ubiquinone/menaquinone biosynthesis C-methylase UbiE
MIRCVTGEAQGASPIAPREDIMSQMNGTREQVIGTYRKSARHYDLAMNFCYLVGFRQWAYRRQAVQALRLRPGDTVVEIGCGTGLNFPLIEQVIGPTGRIIGVDLTEAMLAQARLRVQKHGWQNVSLVEADAVDFSFPPGVNAILSTLALALIPECAQVIAHGSMALPPGGRWVVMDVKFPETAPGWLVAALLPIFRPFAVTEEVVARRPWEAIRIAMQASLIECAWTELCFGFAFLATGARGPGEQ